MFDIDTCLQQMMALRGVLGASLIDVPSGLTVGSAGRAPGGEDRSPHSEAAGLVCATMRTAAFATVGRPQHVEDVVITAGNGYHLMRTLADSGGRLVAYLWLDRSSGNLAVAQRQLGAIATQFAPN